MKGIIVYSAQKTGFESDFKYADPRHFTHVRPGFRYAIIVGDWGWVERAYREANVTVTVVNTSEQLAQLLKDIVMADEKNLDSIVSSADRIEQTLKLAEEADHKLGMAIGATQEALIHVNQVADRFLDVSARINRAFGAGRNRAPEPKPVTPEPVAEKPK